VPAVSRAPVALAPTGIMWKCTQTRVRRLRRPQSLDIEGLPVSMAELEPVATAVGRVLG